MASSSSLVDAEASGHRLAAARSKDLAGVAVALTHAIVRKATEIADARQTEERRRSVLVTDDKVGLRGCPSA